MTRKTQIEHRESEQAFINRLAGELVARPPLKPLWLVSSLWLALGTVYAFALAGLLGPFRPGFAEQLINHPRFLLEMLLGVGALGCFAWAAFAGSIPGVRSAGVQRLGWLLGAAWLFQFVAGLAFPVLEPSMLGKREHCALEAYLYSIPLLSTALWLMHRRFPLDALRSAVYAAIAAGTLPALMMQIACMHEPVHILGYHLLPIGVITAGTGVGTYLIQRLRS